MRAIEFSNLIVVVYVRVCERKFFYHFQNLDIYVTTYDVWFKIKIEKINSWRWITRLTSRWRTQQTVWISVNCRTHWTSIFWTQIAGQCSSLTNACLRVTIKSLKNLIFENTSVPYTMCIARFWFNHSTNVYITRYAYARTPNTGEWERWVGSHSSLLKTLCCSLVVYTLVHSLGTLLTYRSPFWPQIRREHSLNLSILLSEGKETNKDSLSNGEWTGKSSMPKLALFGGARHVAYI